MTATVTRCTRIALGGNQRRLDPSARRRSNLATLIPNVGTEMMYIEGQVKN